MTNKRCKLLSVFAQQNVTFIVDDLLESMLIMKCLWGDKKLTLAINTLARKLKKISQAKCKGACNKCQIKINKLIIKLDALGLSQALATLIDARKKIRKNNLMIP